jgi:predicted nuclease with TOPRIM domain
MTQEDIDELIASSVIFSSKNKKVKHLDEHKQEHLEDIETKLIQVEVEKAKLEQQLEALDRDLLMLEDLAQELKKERERYESYKLEDIQAEEALDRWKEERK